MAIDPICDMTVDEAIARSAERDGQTFAFAANIAARSFSAPKTERNRTLPTTMRATVTSTSRSGEVLFQSYILRAMFKVVTA